MAKKRRKRVSKPKSIVSDELYIPNHSGMLDAGKVHRTPTDDLDPVNKKYVDDAISAVVPAGGNKDIQFNNNGILSGNSAFQWDEGTEQVLIPDGELDAVGLAFGDDINTGIYRVGADSFGIVAGGVEGLRVSEAVGVMTTTIKDNLIVDTDTLVVDATLGHVGIGITTPKEQLHVHSESDNTTMRLQTGTNTNVFDMATNAVGATSQMWQFGVNSANDFVIRDRRAGTTYKWIIEDGFNATALKIDSTNAFISYGDTYWVGAGTGLPYGCIEGTDETVTCTDQNTWYQVTFDTVGPENLMTGSTANNDIVVGKTGVYNVGTTACFHSNPSQDFEIQIKTENGTVDFLHLFQTTAVADKVENCSGTCIIPLTATDTLEVWVRCTSAAGQDAVFNHVNLVASMVGG